MDINVGMVIEMSSSTNTDGRIVIKTNGKVAFSDEFQIITIDKLMKSIRLMDSKKAHQYRSLFTFIESLFYVYSTELTVRFYCRCYRRMKNANGNNYYMHVYGNTDIDNVIRIKPKFKIYDIGWPIQLNSIVVELRLNEKGKEKIIKRKLEDL